MVVPKKILLILVFFFLLPSLSCMNLKQPNPDIEYYTLEYDSPSFPGMERLPYTIKVEPFNISPVYNTTHIIYQKEAYKRDSYTYHRWSVNPSDIVTYLIGRDLKNSGLFKGVLIPGDINREFVFRLGGMIDEFYELDGDKEWSGVLSLSITLTPVGKANKAGMEIFQKNYSVTEKCEKKNPEALAQALSRAMKKVSVEMTEDIYAFIRQGMKG